jgi:hypothetical protein
MMFKWCVIEVAIKCLGSDLMTILIKCFVMITFEAFCESYNITLSELDAIAFMIEPFYNSNFEVLFVFSFECPTSMFTIETFYLTLKAVSF